MAEYNTTRAEAASQAVLAVHKLLNTKNIQTPNWKKLTTDLSEIAALDVTQKIASGQVNTLLALLAISDRNKLPEWAKPLTYNDIVPIRQTIQNPTFPEQPNLITDAGDSSVQQALVEFHSSLAHQTEKLCEALHSLHSEAQQDILRNKNTTLRTMRENLESACVVFALSAQDAPAQETFVKTCNDALETAEKPLSERADGALMKIWRAFKNWAENCIQKICPSYEKGITKQTKGLREISTTMHKIFQPVTPGGEPSDKKNTPGDR